MRQTDWWNGLTAARKARFLQQYTQKTSLKDITEEEIKKIFRIEQKKSQNE